MAEHTVKKAVTRLERVMSGQIDNIPNINITGDHVRACVYIRTASESASACEKTKDICNYYLRLFREHSNWELIDLFEENRTSTFSLQKMIKKTRQGEYDIIITPSFSNFCCHMANTVAAIRELKALSPPVGIYFEIENIFSLEEKTEERCNLYLFIANQESKHKSRVMDWFTAIREQ